MKELQKYREREKGICSVNILDVIHPSAFCDREISKKLSHDNRCSRKSGTRHLPYTRNFLELYSVYNSITASL
jgi:hypothetical protein